MEAGEGGGGWCPPTNETSLEQGVEDTKNERGREKSGTK
jgi:hypothetical protein